MHTCTHAHMHTCCHPSTIHSMHASPLSPMHASMHSFCPQEFMKKLNKPAKAPRGITPRLAAVVVVVVVVSLLLLLPLLLLLLLPPIHAFHVVHIACIGKALQQLLQFLVGQIWE